MTKQNIVMKHLEFPISIQIYVHKEAAVQRSTSEGEFVRYHRAVNVTYILHSHLD